MKVFATWDELMKLEGNLEMRKSRQEEYVE